MQYTLLAIGALAAIAACTPAAMPAAFSAELDNGLEAREATNCTKYCSSSAGCVCTIRPSDCTAFYTVQSGDTCLSIAKSYHNFTVTQFYKWNPSIGQTCSGLQAYVPVCINTPWYKYKPPTQPRYGAHYTPKQTPVPVMPNIIASCKLFELVAPGKTVDALAKENGFKVNQFAKWNGKATTPWADYWVCVKV